MLTSIFANILLDIRYALRGLKNAPGYALTVVLTLGLGLGAVTTMLAIVDSVLWRPLALPHPEQLVLLSGRNTNDGTTYMLSYSQIDELRRNAHSFSAVSGYNQLPRPVTTQDGDRMAVITQVTPDFFAALGVKPKLGRLINASDEKAPVVVVNGSFWQDRLHRDAKAVGSTIRVSGQLRTVIGVLPENLHFPQGTEAPIVFAPMSMDAKTDDLFSDSALVLARMNPGVSVEQAAAEARSVFSQGNKSSNARDMGLEVQSYKEFVTGSLQTSLLALLGGVGALLLIACANAANLQIARATARVVEMNVRSALGASFGRLVQQVVTESIVVSMMGAALGCALAAALVAAIHRAYGGQFARFDELALHPEVFSACALLAIAVGVLASLAPVFGVRRQTRIAATSAGRTSRRVGMQGVLVALQIGLTCVLLVASGLFVKTFRALEDVKLGFDPKDVTTLVLMPDDQHKDPELSRQEVGRLLERFSSLPGIEAATTQTDVPFSNWNVTLTGSTDVSGRAFQKDDRAFYSLVSSNFIEASGLHLQHGRDFLPQDDSGSSGSVIVNEEFVKRFIAGRDPLGVSIKSHRDAGDKDSDLPFPQFLTIVGVVENEMQGGNLGAPYQPMVYVDYKGLPKGSFLGQIYSVSAEFAIRSPLAQDVLNREIRTAIKQVAPDMTEMALQPMAEGIASSLSERRLALRMVAGFGGVALVLAAIGIYGVLGYAVAQRRREIGIRMALGSSRSGITNLVLRQAAIMVVWGLAAGAAGAWPVSRFVKSFLFGVKALDPWTIVFATAILLLVAAVAAAVPAWRAAQVDPTEALRAE